MNITIPLPPLTIEIRRIADVGVQLGFKQLWPLEDGDVELNLVVIPAEEWPAIREAIDKAMLQYNRSLS